MEAKDIRIGDEVELSFNMKVCEITTTLIWGHTPNGKYVCAPVLGVVKREVVQPAGDLLQ